MKKLCNVLLCLALLFCALPTAAAASLDTADIQVQGDTISIGKNQDSVLSALHAKGKTAKIAVPYAKADVYVLKDQAQIVPHNWDKAGYLQFEVPGAGTYVIHQGLPPTLDEQLQEDKQNIAILEDQILNANHSVADGTTIHANGNQIKSSSGTKALTSSGQLTIRNLKGSVDLMLGPDDRVGFHHDGTVSITAAMDYNAAGDPVGYGHVTVTSLIGGNSVTYTYFLVPGESLSIIDGKVSGYSTFSPADAAATHPNYRISYTDHKNTHQLGSQGQIQAHCNGLYSYYTSITLTREGTSTPILLAKKAAEGSIYGSSGIRVENGSTILTLNATYLNALAEGSHTLTFHYNDGASTQSTLRIYKSQSAAQADPSNPKTGDSVILPATTLLVSGCLLVALLKKRLSAPRS